ncbi:hypothetical protein [Streptomyces prasinus]
MAIRWLLRSSAVPEDDRQRDLLALLFTAFVLRFSVALESDRQSERSVISPSGT